MCWKAIPWPARDHRRLNRAFAALEPAGRASKPRGREAFAIGPVTPLVVRGPAPVLSWTPPRLPPASDDTIMRLLGLYRHTDPASRHVWRSRMELSAIARRRDGYDASRQRPAPAAPPRQQPGRPGARLLPPAAGGGRSPSYGRTSTHRRRSPGSSGYRRANWRPARPVAPSTRRCRDQTQHGVGLARDCGGDRHRIRPHRASMAPRARPRFSAIAVLAGARSSARDRRLARPQVVARTKAATSKPPSTCAPCSGLLGPPADGRQTLPPPCLTRRGEADGGAGGLRRPLLHRR